MQYKQSSKVFPSLNISWLVRIKLRRKIKKAFRLCLISLPSSSRWARAWQASFFVLHTLVFALSLTLYLLLARAVAAISSASKSRSKETPTYFFVALAALTCLIEYVLAVQQLILAADGNVGALSTFVCRLFTYFTYGNKVLQVKQACSLPFSCMLLRKLYSSRSRKDCRKNCRSGLLENKCKQWRFEQISQCGLDMGVITLNILRGRIFD